MPDIDLDDVLVSLDIACQLFSVVRRQEHVNGYGESVLTATLLENVRGAVQPLGDNSLLREEAYSTGNNGLTVWSMLPLFSAEKQPNGMNFQPDLVLWQDLYYVVRGLNNWTDFGQGFTVAECLAFEKSKVPIIGARLDLSKPSNSQYVPGLVA